MISTPIVVNSVGDGLDASTCSPKEQLPATSKRATSVFTSCCAKLGTPNRENIQNQTE